MSHSNFSVHQDSYTRRVPQPYDHREPTHILAMYRFSLTKSDDTIFRMIKFISPRSTVVVALVRQYFEQRLMKKKRWQKLDNGSLMVIMNLYYFN